MIFFLQSNQDLWLCGYMFFFFFFSNKMRKKIREKNPFHSESNGDMFLIGEMFLIIDTSPPGILKI
jgi:hypothetical protein